MITWICIIFFSHKWYLNNQFFDNFYNNFLNLILTSCFYFISLLLWFLCHYLNFFVHFFWSNCIFLLSNKLSQQKVAKITFFEQNSQVLQRATHQLDEWRAAQAIRSCSSAQPTISQARATRPEEDNWKKLALGRYKCNIDASFSTSLNMVGLGMCLRDDDGVFVLAKMEWFAPLCDIDVGEAIGLHTALDWISNQQFDNVDFALDCKRVVDCVNSSIDDSSEHY